MDNHTEHRMELLRGQLIAMATRKQTFLHRDVLMLSQSLDQLIVKAQTEKQRTADAKPKITEESVR